MSWQDELRRLDEERVAGRISEEDYQWRRAELAAQADSERGGTPGQKSPFPPAFRWVEASKETPDETMDVIDPVGGGDAESTQVLPAQPPPGPSYDDPESTQVVQARPPSPSRYDPPSSSSPGGGFPAAPDQWAARESVPPWVSSDLAPFQQPSSEWMARGQDTFESQRSSKTPLVAAIVAVVVVLLVGGGLGAYWLGGSNGTSDADQPPVAQRQPAAPEQQPPPGREPPPAPPSGSELPAPAGIDGEPRVLSTPGQLRSADVLPSPVYAVLAEAGATSSKLVSSDEGGLRATVLITRLGSGEEAAAARDELADLRVQAGFEEAAPSSPKLRIFRLIEDPETGPTTVRGFYRSGDLLVWVEVVGQELVPTARRYAAIVTEQATALPAEI